MKGHALHIGVNYCNPRDYADCQLDGAIPDALALRDATTRLSFVPLNGDGTLTDDAATEKGIVAAIESAAATVQSGELLLITFHGLGVPLDFEAELAVLQRRRGWVSSDGRVVDVSEILEALSGAPKGARVLVVSSCCFIGAQPGPEVLSAERVATAAPGKRRVVTGAVPNPRVGTARYRRMVLEAARAREATNGALATTEKTSVKSLFSRAKTRQSAGGATVYHLAACGIDETISDGTSTTRSPFAAKLIEMLSGDPQPFHNFEADLRLGLDPDPQLEKFPVDPAFDASGPFLQGDVFPKSIPA